MKLFRRWRADAEPQPSEPPLAADEDPFAEPVELEIRDAIDLHFIPPRQVAAVVQEYLLQAR